MTYELKYKEAYDKGFEDALQLVRYCLKLRKMGVADCQIVKKFDLPPAFLHDLTEWAQGVDGQGD